MNQFAFILWFVTSQFMCLSGLLICGVDFHQMISSCSSWMQVPLEYQRGQLIFSLKFWFIMPIFGQYPTIQVDRHKVEQFHMWNSVPKMWNRSPKSGTGAESGSQFQKLWNSFTNCGAVPQKACHFKIWNSVPLAYHIVVHRHTNYYFE